MAAERPDETMHRLADWTGPQWQSEQLAAQVIHAEGYQEVDPTHPYGGPDGRTDALAIKDGQCWIMGSWFPNERQPPAEIRRKVLHDFEGVETNAAHGLVFVTNQKIGRRQREELEALLSGRLDLFHRDRVVHVLERPEMGSIRQRYLHLGPSISEQSMIDRSANLSDQLSSLEEHLQRISQLDAVTMPWLQEGSFLIDRVTEIRASDMRVRDPLLRGILDRLRRAWSELGATAN